MAKSKRIRVEADLSRWADVEDLLHFVELRNSTAKWRGKLELDDDDLLELQLAIMLAPKGNPVVPGTGSLRQVTVLAIAVAQRQTRSVASRVCLL